MKKFRNVPAIMTLLAGFVTSVVMIIRKYSLNTFLWILLLVMAGFYLGGVLIQFCLNKASAAKEEEQEETSEGTQEGTEEEKEDVETHSEQA